MQVEPNSVVEENRQIRRESQKMWHEIKVVPWIGEEYRRPGLFPYRTALLGESNYTMPDKFTPELVVQCVRGYLGANRDPNFSRFATKIRRLVLEDSSCVSAQTFWSNVAFYNFVQERVGNSARARPTKKMWGDSVAAFHEFVERLRPERLWVLGKANWENLLYHVEHSPLDQHTVQLAGVSGTVIAAYTNHPSSSLTYATWRPVIERLLFQEHFGSAESAGEPP